MSGKLPIIISRSTNFTPTLELLHHHHEFLLRDWLLWLAQVQHLKGVTHGLRVSHHQMRNSTNRNSITSTSCVRRICGLWALRSNVRFSMPRWIAHIFAQLWLHGCKDQISEPPSPAPNPIGCDEWTYVVCRRWVSASGACMIVSEQRRVLYV